MRALLLGAFLSASMVVPSAAQVVQIAVERALVEEMGLEVGDTVRLGTAPDSMRRLAVIAATREALSGAEEASETERGEALAGLATRLDGMAAGAKNPAKVRLVAGVVRQLAASPRLARGQ